MDHKVIEYVDDVMSKVSAPDDFKLKLENRLFRQVLSNGSGGVDDIKEKLGSPGELANNISSQLIGELRDNSVSEPLAQNTQNRVQPENRPPQHHQGRNPHPRYMGELTREDSNVNLKLLYIPLIQISSGTQRITRPLYDDDDDE
jgi:hypothetical protein